MFHAPIPILRYSSVVIAMAVGFVNFVACGAKMYQISLEGDTSPQAINLSGITQGTYGIHTPAGWGGGVPIPIQFSHEISLELKDSILRAMNTWETAVGKKLFHVVAVHEKTGDDFVDLYSSLSDDINGYYRDDAWAKTGKSHQVIATTVWDSSVSPGDPTQLVISAGDIRFNYEHYNIGNSLKLVASDSRAVVDMESLALHELGHLLGLAHIPQKDDPYSIMNPALLIGEGLANRRISKGDVVRIQKIYGCAAEACDVDAVYQRLESMAVSTVSSQR